MEGVDITIFYLTVHQQSVILTESTLVVMLERDGAVIRRKIVFVVTAALITDLRNSGGNQVD